MKIGILTEGYSARCGGLEEGLRCLCADGYECVDYSEFIDTERPKFQCSEAEFDALVRHDRAFIESLGLEISQTHGPWRWPPRDATEEDRRERFEKMSRAIRGTAILGCRNFVIHSVMPWGEEDSDPKAMRDINLEFMGRLCRVAEKNGVVICFENMPMPKLSLASPEACLGFVREINSPNFRICLDTGHCTMLGVRPGDAVRLLGRDMLAVLHVHDNDGKNDLHWQPYTGVIDWDDFRSALREIGFEGPLSLESKLPAEFTPENRRNLMRTALRLAGRL